jgi:hypothetical protein
VGFKLLFISEMASAKSLLYKNVIALSIWAVEQLWVGAFSELLTSLNGGRG